MPMSTMSVRSLCLSGAGLCVLLIAAAAAAEEPTRTLTLPAEITAPPGGTVEIAVNIDEADGVLGYRAVIEYATPVLSFVAGSVQHADTLTASFLAPAVNDARPGALVMASAGPQRLAPGGGTLVRFSLAVSADAMPGATFPVRWNRRYTRLNDGSLPVAFTDGSVQVVAPEEP